MGVSAAGPLRVALDSPASAPLQEPTSSRSLDAHLASLQLDPGSCWGSLQERDSLGVTYRYRALVVSGHKQQGARGYFYLQRDPDDLTVGWLVRD